MLSVLSLIKYLIMPGLTLYLQRIQNIYISCIKIFYSMKARLDSFHNTSFIRLDSEICHCYIHNYMSYITIITFAATFLLNSYFNNTFRYFSTGMRQLPLTPYGCFLWVHKALVYICKMRSSIATAILSAYVDIKNSIEVS